MALMQASPVARETLLENEALLKLGCIEESPADCVQWRMNGVAQLKSKEPLRAFVDSVVVWLGDANAVVIPELDQPPVLDREAKEPVERIVSDARVHCMLPASLRAAPHRRGAASIVHDPGYGR